MKKVFLGILFLAGVFSTVPGFAAEEGRWGAFGAVSDVDPDETGIGGGAFFEKEMVDNIYIVGQGFVATYDNFDRGQVLLGGEWRDDSQRNLNGYIGLLVGADLVDTDAGSEEDAFARAYYDIGWQYAQRAEFRFGIAIDAKNDYLDRDQGARLGWFYEREDSFGFFVRGEFYGDENNVFAGASWGF